MHLGPLPAEDLAGGHCSSRGGLVWLSGNVEYADPSACVLVRLVTLYTIEGACSQSSGRVCRVYRCMRMEMHAATIALRGIRASEVGHSAVRKACTSIWVLDGQYCRVQGFGTRLCTRLMMAACHWQERSSFPLSVWQRLWSCCVYTQWHSNLDPTVGLWELCACARLTLTVTSWLLQDARQSSSKRRV